MQAGQMRKGEAIFWIVLGVCICFLGWRIRIGNFHSPGPGLFALIAGLALVVIGLLMRLSKPGPKAEGGAVPAAGAVGVVQGLFQRRLVGTMALLVAYAVFLNVAGYLICTFFVMLGLFCDWGRNRLVNGLLAALVTTGVTYLIFETWLRTQLPRGIFPWW